MRPPATRRAARAPVLAAGALIAAAPGRRPAADPPLLYLNEEAASVVHDGVGGGTPRQAPIRPNPRWPAARTVGKVAGRDLAGAGARRIAALLRAGVGPAGVGSLVGVDEICPATVDGDGARSLATALDRLGPNARRVVFYAAPGAGRAGGARRPWRPCPPSWARWWTRWPVARARPTS